MTKAVGILFVVIACLLILPAGLAVIGGLFGILMGAFGAVFGVVGGIFSAVFGVIAWIFEGLFSWNWPFSFYHCNPVMLVVILIVAALVVKAKQKDQAR